MPMVLMHSPGAKEMGYVLQGPFCCTHPRWPVMKLVTRTCSLLSLTRTPPGPIRNRLQRHACARLITHSTMLAYKQ